MNSYNDVFLDLPENGTIIVSSHKTSALILNQIPSYWNMTYRD